MAGYTYAAVYWWQDWVDHKEPIDFPGLQIGSEEIIPSQIARNIDLVMDTGLTFSTQVSNVVSAAFSHLKNIASIYYHLTNDATQSLVRVYGTNKLDYCNFVIYLIVQVVQRQKML